MSTKAGSNFLKDIATPVERKGKINPQGKFVWRCMGHDVRANTRSEARALFKKLFLQELGMKELPVGAGNHIEKIG